MRRRLPLHVLLALVVVATAVPAAAELRAKFELFVDDVERSKAFYRVLGFEVAHEKASDGYTTLRNGAVVVALSPLPRWLRVSWLGFLRLPPIGTEIVFYPDSIVDARSALALAGYVPGAIELQTWGDRDFRIRDPDGYYVRVSEGQPVPAN